MRVRLPRLAGLVLDKEKEARVTSGQGMPLFRRSGDGRDGGGVRTVRMLPTCSVWTLQRTRVLFFAVESRLPLHFSWARSRFPCRKGNLFHVRVCFCVPSLRPRSPCKADFPPRTNVYYSRSACMPLAAVRTYLDRLSWAGDVKYVQASVCVYSSVSRQGRACLAPVRV